MKRLYPQQKTTSCFKRALSALISCYWKN